MPIAQPVVAYPPRLILGGASSRGRVRERNEDRFLTQQWNWNDAEGTHEVALLVVSDGMGGYQAGDEASSLTARTVANHFGPVVVAAASGRPTDGAAIAAALHQSLHEANRVVHQRAKKRRCLEPMAR